MKNTNANETKIEKTNVPSTGSDFEESNVLDFSATLRKLRENVDPHLVRQRAGRRDRSGQLQMVEYVEWHTVADILDSTAPNWGHTVKDIRSIGEIITVTVAISIDGVTREGIGTGKAASETGIKKAEHDALKRAAVKFGIARELYKKEFDSIDHYDESPQRVERPPAGDAVAKSLSELVTGKQLGMIRAIGRAGAVDPAIECQRLFACGIDELSKRAASDLIDHLQDLQRDTAIAVRRAG